MPSSQDKFNEALKRRRGIAVAEPEAPTAEPGTMEYEFQSRKIRSAQKIRDAEEQKAKREQQKDDKRASAQVTGGGVNLDAETLKAKAAYEAEKRAPKNAAAALPTFDAILAVLEKYFDTDAGKTIYRSEDNVESFSNYLVKRLILGEIELTLEACANAHAYLLQNGFLEFAPGESFDPETGGIVHNRGDVTRPASRVFPRFFHPSHEVQDRLVKMYEDQQRWREETAQIRKDLDSGELSFEELQKSVRKHFKKGRIL